MLSAQDICQPICPHVDSMRSATVGVLTPQKWADTSNPGTTVGTDVPEAPPPGGWAQAGQLAPTACLRP